MILDCLRSLIRWIHRKQRKALEQQRKEALQTFVHETLPDKIEGFRDRLIITSGTFNYFVLPSGKLPSFDYVFPEIPLFISALTPENSDKRIAEYYGVGQKTWEQRSADRAAAKEGVSDMPMSERPIPPLFWELEWEAPLDQDSLLNDFRTKLRISK